MFKNQVIHLPVGIAIQQSILHGNGVFARKQFSAGNVIEIAPVILMDQTDKEFLQSTILFNYYFLLSDKSKPVALGLGYTSLYNHSYNANASYTISLKNASIKIKAFKAISAGDEITLNYNGKPDDTTPVYFLQEDKMI